jgi:Domain of unknown function (DUF6471)
MGYIIIYDIFFGRFGMSQSSPAALYEEQAKNILKSELKRRGVTYAQLAEKLTERGVKENERNLANKISRGSFTAAFFMMCMDAIGVRQVSLEA